MVIRSPGRVDRSAPVPPPVPDIDVATARRLGPPSAAIAELLPTDVVLDETGSLRHPAAVGVWWGMLWGRLGRGDLAWACFDAVTAPQLQPWIAAERGRLLRELGDHAAAARLEAPALPHADDPIDRAMLRISLAADAIGLAEPDEAGRHLGGAAHLLERVPRGPRADRQRLRSSWVAVEVAWAAGRRPPADGLPVRDPDGGIRLPGPYEAGTRFHLAKGLLFAGAVRADVDLLDRALAIAPPALWWAVQLARAEAGVVGARRSGLQARAAIVPPPQ